MQGLVLSPPFSQEVVRSLRLMACCFDFSSIHTLDCSDCSDLIVTPSLALILVLIVVSPILSLLLWLTLIEPQYVLGLLYCLVS